MIILKVISLIFTLLFGTSIVGKIIIKDNCHAVIFLGFAISAALFIYSMGWLG